MNDDITAHYSFGGLRNRIEQGLSQIEGPVTVASLGAVDEFHVGGRPATTHLVDQLGLTNDDHVLDIGSGLGGLARFIASETGARVTGIDLVAEYVDVAGWLTELVGLGDRCTFVHGSAAQLPTPGEGFTAATMLHVGMNIPDKNRVFDQVASALGPGRPFGIYDIMLAGETRPDYPMPWAASPATSELESAAAYCATLEAVGFEIESVDDRTESGLAAFGRLAAAAANGPPALGLHLVMGPTTPTKIGNLVAAIRNGVLAPTEIVARRSSA